MFVGHLGIGLALSARSRRFRLGTLLGAALLLDVLLGAFVLAGWERVIVPPDFATAHYLEFVFPYSHGLLATLVWTAVTAALASTGLLLLGRGRAAAWVAAAAVASHWVCDVIEHVRGLPLLGPGSPRVGLGLWSAMGWALLLEVLLLVVGAGLFLRSRPGLPRGRRTVLLLVLGGVAILQVASQLSGSEVPPARVLALTWVAQAAALTVLGLWADPVLSSPAGSPPAGRLP
ncbi:MAG: hypothetical protein ACXU81_02500 [Myxococcaceae bacterium]